jgi:hypothetical protein
MFSTLEAPQLGRFAQIHAARCKIIKLRVDSSDVNLEMKKTVNTSAPTTKSL